MKKIKWIFVVVFLMAIGTAFATHDISKTKKFNVTAYRVSNCTTTASVACHQATTQNCTFNFSGTVADVKLKDALGNCTVNLAFDE